MTIRAYTNLSRVALLARGLSNHTPHRLSVPKLGEEYSGLIQWDAKQGRFFVEFELNGIHGTVSAPYRELFVMMRVAFYTSLPTNVRNPRRGEYRYRTALCEYESPYSPIEAERLEDLVHLYGLIRSGRIAPDASYLEPQVETMPREFRQLWREFWALARRQMSEWRFRMDRYASTPR